MSDTGKKLVERARQAVAAHVEATLVPPLNPAKRAATRKEMDAAFAALEAALDHSPEPLLRGGGDLN